MIESFVQQLNDKNLLLEDRFSAILALVKFYYDSCLPYLKEILEDSTEHPELRSAVALGMAKLGEESLTYLEKHLYDENPTVRIYIVQAIGMVGEKGIPYLLQALKDNDNDVFYTAADAIGSIGHPAVPYLTKLLDDGADDAKCVAAWKLGEIKDPSAIPAVISAVKNENNNDDIIALSVWALGELARENTNNKSIISTLYRVTRKQKPELKRLAFIALNKAREYLN